MLVWNSAETARKEKYVVVVIAVVDGCGSVGVRIFVVVAIVVVVRTLHSYVSEVSLQQGRQLQLPFSSRFFFCIIRTCVVANHF